MRAAALLLVVLLLAACSDGGDGGGQGASGSSVPPTTTAGGGVDGGGTLRLGMVGDAAGSPALADLAELAPSALAPDDRVGLVLADLLTDPLLVLPAMGPDGSAMGEGVEPGLATSVEPDTDLMVWTITLGEATFADGSPVTGDDVAATLAAAAGRGSESAIGRAMAVVEGTDEVASGAATELTGVEVVDDQTVVVSLVEPYAPFPELLASPLLGVVPAGSGGAAVGAGVSGPYEVVEPGGAEAPAVLERSGVGIGTGSGDAGAGGDAGVGGPDRVEVVAYGSLDEAMAGFDAGEVDWVPLPASSPVVGEGVADGMVVTVPGPAVWWVGVDAAQPTLSDPTVRQGVVHAIDGDGIALDLGAGVVGRRSLVPPSVPGGVAGACLPGCAYDPAEAERLLAEAMGATGGSDGESLAVPLSSGAGPDGLAAAIADEVAEDLQAVGVAARADEGPGVFPWRVVPVVPSPDGYLRAFGSTSPANSVRVSSSAINGQLAVARATADPAERAEAYELAQDYVIEQAVAAPVGQELVAHAVSSRVRGFAPRWDGTFVVDQLGVAGE